MVEGAVHANGGEKDRSIPAAAKWQLERQTTRLPESNRTTNNTIASTSSTWMNPPRVYELTTPISHKTTSTASRVSNMIFPPRPSARGERANLEGRCARARPTFRHHKSTDDCC